MKLLVGTISYGIRGTYIYTCNSTVGNSHALESIQGYGNVLFTYFEFSIALVLS